MTTNFGDIFEVAARLEYDGGEDVVNVFQFRSEVVAPQLDSVTTTDLIAALEAMYTLLQAFISVTTIYRDIRIRNKTTQQLMGTFPWNTLSAGTSIQDQMPHAVSAMVSFPTATPRVVMRKYFPRLTEGACGSTGVWEAGVVNVLVAMGAALMGNNGTAGRTYTYGYLSPKTGTFILPVAAVITNIPAYQRRRKPGRGS